MIYNLDIVNTVLHIYDHYGESVRFDIERLEELLSDENPYMIEESYLFVQSIKYGLYDAMILDEDADRYGYITYLIEHHHFIEEEAVFMVAICNEIIKKMGYYFEIPELKDMLNKAYETADFETLSIIARTYFDGFGIRQDYEKAYEIYLYLYTQGYMPSASYLGYMYEYGLGVEQNLKKAFHYYTSYKDDYCWYYLGLMYLHGTYVTQDYDKALECFIQSEYDDAYMYQGMLLERQKKYAEAFISFKKGADRFQEECLYKTASYLYQGRGVIADLKEAIKYYQYGYYFKQGDCAYELAMYLISEDKIDIAIALLKQSVDMYNLRGCMTLAKLYGHGLYVDRDLKLSNYYYQKLSEIKIYIDKKIKEGIRE